VDDDHLAELYAAHRLGLVRMAVLLVDDLGSAEDVVQDAFAAFALRGGHLRDRSAALAYLRVSVVNGCRSALRRRRTARAYTPPHEVEPDGPDARAVLSEEHREVLAALDRLAPRQREVLVLRYWSGMSEAEIASALDISRGSVKSTASRALTALEKILPDPEEGR
jgi:RNA polymerase sigma-70 factor (sigma-E family)